MQQDSGNIILYHEHRFVILILQTLGRRYQKEDPLLPKDQEWFLYAQRVNFQLIKIQHTLKSLRLARVFLAERHPLVYNYKQEKSTISFGEYLRYHIENYFLRITTYKDQILQLYNIVHVLEVKTGLGFEKRLHKKAADKNLHDLDAIMVSVENLISKAKPIRNRIAHEGYHHDSDLGLAEAGFEYIHDKDANEKGFNEAAWLDIIKSIIMENVREMMQNEKEFGTHFFGVLDLLLKPAQENIDRLH